jgi:hypothetical protein
VLPQMRRDYQALSLANSLDPKRFMKGGNRSGKIPETFAVCRFLRSWGKMLMSDWYTCGSTTPPARYYSDQGETVSTWSACSELDKGRGHWIVCEEEVW